MKSDDLVTPADIEREMVDLTTRIDRAPSTLKEFHEKVRAARQAHKKAYALAYASAVGTQMDRKMQADLDTEDTLKALDDAEISYKFVTDTFDSLSKKLRALQSVSSLMKASMFGSTTGGM
jgi:cysteinyl-tRNA synthetase